MEIAIAIIFSLLVMTYIGYPFYQSRRRRISFELNHRAEELETRKAEIYATIKDIEFDYQMGKLSKEDYDELKNQYKSQAVNLLKEIDLADRAHLGEAYKPSMINFCHQCGVPAGKDDKFCANCGVEFE